MVDLTGPCDIYFISIGFFVYAHRKRVCRLMKIQMCSTNNNILYKKLCKSILKHVNCNDSIFDLTPLFALVTIPHTSFRHIPYTLFDHPFKSSHCKFSCCFINSLNIPFNSQFFTSNYRYTVVSFTSNDCYASHPYCTILALLFYLTSLRLFFDVFYLFSLYFFVVYKNCIH